ARLVGQPSAKLVRELFDRRLYRPCRGIAERTKRLALDVVADVQEELCILGPAAACRYTVKNLNAPVCTLAARCTPTARLVLIKLAEVFGRFHNVDRFVHHDHAACAKHRACSYE